MPGSLYHAKRFQMRPYMGADQREHWEVEPIEGDSDTVSLSSWGALIAYCAGLGVPEELWPTFYDCECAIDVPLEEVEVKQPKLREALLALDAPQVSGHYLLSRVVEYIRRGEVVFFTN